MVSSDDSKPSDPFAHHPGLRELIVDPDRSSYRSFNVERLAQRMRERGLPVDWWHSDAVREESRITTLSGRWTADLWVFAYGSLMWDPGFRFAEVRRAYAPEHARRFILKDIHGGRGTKDRPGLMAALDEGSGCNGLAFRIERDCMNCETEILWRREKLAPAYIAEFIPVELSDGTIEALTFLADPEADIIDTELPREDQIRFLATGTGIFGSSLDYLKNIVAHFDAMGIRDIETEKLLRDALAHPDAEKDPSA